MKNKSIKTASIIFIIAVIVQITAVAGNFYIQHRLTVSQSELDQYQEIEREFFKALSRENMLEKPFAFSDSHKVTILDPVLEKIRAINNSTAEKHIVKRKELLSSITIFSKEKQEMHKQIGTLLPSLTSSIQYIHDHHIAHLSNLVKRGVLVQDYEQGRAFKKQDDQPAPETYIIKAAIDIHGSLLNVFETFGKLQLGVSPTIIRNQFNTAIHNFYQAVNVFEDYSLDAQDGILIEELVINGQAFESRFKRFLEIETQIIELTRRLSNNKEQFAGLIEDYKQQLSGRHSSLSRKFKLLQLLSIVTFAAMIFLVIWYGHFLIQGFGWMIQETKSIRNDIGYRIPHTKKGFREFAVVSRALNQMGDTIQAQVDALERSKYQLEQRVNERTLELSVVNEKLKKEIQERIVSEKERGLLEKRLIQSHKMEAIGTLSGGIAHDFNNILSGIFGYSELTLKHRNNPQKIESYVGQILNGARRAAALIQQILTFSRQSEIRKSPLVISVVVKEALKLLRSSIPSSIDIHENIFSQESVMADPTQIHQVIMNLCTNGYHAMRNTGGTLTVELTDIDISNRKGERTFKIPPGKYIKLVVSDTGTGMSSDMLNKIFDPYFTTKKIGEGTGLGLALTYGIVEEHQGYIQVKSTLGEGSKFYVFFPVVSSDDSQESLTENIAQPVGGTERIMLIDDEKDLLDATSELLMDYGYRVTSFSNPEAAFNAFKEEPQAFDLIITDMTMPRMNGDDLAVRMLSLRKDLPIILCTGYSDKITKNDALKMGIKRYFQKPVDSRELFLSIKEIAEAKN